MSYDQPTSPSAAYAGKSTDRIGKNGAVPGTDGAREGASPDQAGKAYDAANRKVMANPYATGETAMRRTVHQTFRHVGDGTSNFGEKMTETVTPRPKRGVSSS